LVGRDRDLGASSLVAVKHKRRKKRPWRGREAKKKNFSKDGA